MPNKKAARWAAFRMGAVERVQGAPPLTRIDSSTIPPDIRLSATRDQRQPACLSQALRAAGFAFSHCVIERVSFSSIFSFMQTQ